MCNTKSNFIQKDYATALDKDTLKSALTGLASPEQTWPPAARIQKAKNEFSVTFFKSGDQLKWDCEWFFFSNFKNLKLIYRP